MSKRLLHSVAVQEIAVAADVITTNDLAVNPLSVVLICIRPLNETSTLSAYARYMEMVGSLNRVTILFRGQSIFSMPGRDAAALNYCRHGILPREVNPDDADNERRCVVLPILLGRFAYDPVSCFPASRRGELALEMDIDVADTGYDGFRYSVETVEILGIEPKEYERKTVIGQTMVVGENNIAMPAGNDIRGVLAFGTTGFTGAAPAPSLGRVGIYLDNQQVGYGSSDFEVAAMLGSLLGRQPPGLDLHTHRVPTNAGANEETTGPIEQAMGGWENYIFLDTDPTRDDDFSLKTKGSYSFFLRSTAETADAVRVVPVERIMVD